MKFRPFAGPAKMANPMAMAAIGGVAIVRGLVSLCTASTPHLNYGPALPYLDGWAVGLAWLMAGLILHVSLWRREMFKTAVSMLVGCFTVWSILYACDLMINGLTSGLDLANVVSLALYVCLVIVTITLADQEVEHQERNGRAK